MSAWTKSARYAILVGINSYKSEDSRPLKGCVHDVNEISRKLKQSVPDVRIYSFTASESPDPDATQPVELKEHWPTYDNISSCFDHVIQQGQRGDHVYFHFSGHSTVIPPCMPHSDWNNGDLALVVLEGPTSSEERYFNGVELAERLRDMVEKGLSVTMVLDCCSSGSTLRNDETVRYSPYRSEVDEKYPPRIRDTFRNDDDAGEGAHGFAPRGLRQASQVADWLARPDGYAILTSSDATERSFEVKFENPESNLPHGMLSYFLLDSFDMLGGVGGPMRQLHESISMRAWNHRRARTKTQNPVLFGNENQLFFGCSRPGCSGYIPVMGTADTGKSELLLRAGRAHRISEGDQFVLDALGRGSSPGNAATVMAEVVKVRGLTSDLRVTDGNAAVVETGWLATPTTQLALRKFPIRLDVRDDQRAEWQDALRLRASLAEYREGSDSSGTGGWSFAVVQTSGTVFEVRDSQSRPVTSLAVTDDADVVRQQLLNRLQHLTSYSFVRCLVNEVEDTGALRLRGLLRAFLVATVDGRRFAFEPGCAVSRNVYEACFHPSCVLPIGLLDKFSLRVENLAERHEPPLCVYVYSLGSSWEVKGLLGASREVIPPKGSGYNFKATGIFEMKLKFGLGEGQDECEDVIRVFFTQQPTTFTTLALPKLGEFAGRIEPKVNERRGSVMSEDWGVWTFRVRTMRKTG